MAMNKRKRKHLSHSRLNFSSMPADLLDKIISCLEDYKDKILFKLTCRSWFYVAKSHVKYLLENNSPILFISDSSPEDETNNNNVGLVFNLKENSEKPLMLHNFPQGSSCIGSSGGWLLFLESSYNLFIVHYILGAKIFLPPVHKFPGFDYKATSPSKHWINKFILWGDPIVEKDYGVAVIYGRSYTKLAFFKHGDSKWTNLEGSDKNYSDIICHDGFIFALTDSRFIEKYRILGNPEKIMKIKPLSPNNIIEFNKDDFRELYYSQFYLVESNGSLLLVIRCIGNHVYNNGEVIREEDLIEPPYCEVYCPYMTKNFYVYKLNSKKVVWEKLTSLDDQILFIGGNHSFALSAKNCVECNENSIYYTDDNWDQIMLAEEQYNDFGGHDMGVFNLTKGKFQDVYESNTSKTNASFWILQS